MAIVFPTAVSVPVTNSPHGRDRDHKLSHRLHRGARLQYRREGRLAGVLLVSGQGRRMPSGENHIDRDTVGAPLPCRALHQPEQARFRRSVGGLTRTSLNSRVRADQKDRASALPLHHRACSVKTMKRSRQDRPQDPIPGIL